MASHWIPQAASPTVPQQAHAPNAPVADEAVRERSRDEGPLQFSIAEMFTTTFLSAVVLSVLKTFGAKTLLVWSYTLGLAFGPPVLMFLWFRKRCRDLDLW